MFKRMLWLCIGVGAGLAFGFMAFRKMYQTTRYYAPGAVVDRWADRAAQAMREGKKAFREREDTLWERLERADRARRPR
jgi:hypothetical protein